MRAAAMGARLHAARLALYCLARVGARCSARFALVTPPFRAPATSAMLVDGAGKMLQNKGAVDAPPPKGGLRIEGMAWTNTL